jgi:outer membrane protein OmpA-like peptidoglycan-associated protein
MVDVPQNPMGYQFAHSGTCYAGLFAFSHEDYREYLQTPLTAPLEKGKRYIFSMYVSLADYSRTFIDQLGVCFLTDRVKYNSGNIITNLTPVYIKVDDEVGKDIKNWHRVTITYKAQGGESYLLLGSFDINKIQKTKYKAPKEIKSRINQTSERDAYYFIDDVSLVETTVIENEPPVIVKTELDTLDKIPADTALVLKNVLFKSGKAILLPSSYADLDKIVDYLNKNSNLRIELSGHSDNTGSEIVNQKLSAERAKAVADYLIKKRIDRQIITTVGYGGTKPLVPNDSEEHKQQNRRVDFVISSSINHLK